jgi:hypothetical protein
MLPVGTLIMSPADRAFIIRQRHAVDAAIGNLTRILMVIRASHHDGGDRIGSSFGKLHCTRRSRNSEISIGQHEKSCARSLTLPLCAEPELQCRGPFGGAVHGKTVFFLLNINGSALVIIAGMEIWSGGGGLAATAAFSFSGVDALLRSVPASAQAIGQGSLAPPFGFQASRYRMSTPS